MPLSRAGSPRPLTGFSLLSWGVSPSSLIIYWFGWYTWSVPGWSVFHIHSSRGWASPLISSLSLAELPRLRFPNRVPLFDRQFYTFQFVGLLYLRTLCYRYLTPFSGIPLSTVESLYGLPGFVFSRSVVSFSSRQQQAVQSLRIVSSRSAGMSLAHSIVSGFARLASWAQPACHPCDSLNQSYLPQVS